MSAEPAPEHADGLTVRVVRGGEPSSDEAAALAATLLSVRGAAPSGAVQGPSAWQRAALLEAVGGSRFAERAALEGLASEALRARGSRA